MIIPYEIFKENKRFKESIDNAQNETDISVSYTHLDVYKRQA